MHKWQDDGFKTPMSRAKGLGASHSGVKSWIVLRLTAIANIPLLAWFVWFCISSIGMEHHEFVAFLGYPVNAVLMILLIISFFWHGLLGCREIIEDYIQLEWFKNLKLIGMYLFFSAAIIIGVFCVLKVAFSVGVI